MMQRLPDDILAAAVAEVGPAASVEGMHYEMLRRSSSGNNGSPKEGCGLELGKWCAVCINK